MLVDWDDIWSGQDYNLRMHLNWLKGDVVSCANRNVALRIQPAAASSSCNLSTRSAALLDTRPKPRTCQCMRGTVLSKICHSTCTYQPVDETEMTNRMSRQMTIMWCRQQLMTKCPIQRHSMHVCMHRSNMPACMPTFACLHTSHACLLSHAYSPWHAHAKASTVSGMASVLLYLQKFLWRNQAKMSAHHAGIVLQAFSVRFPHPCCQTALKTFDEALLQPDFLHILLSMFPNGASNVLNHKRILRVNYSCPCLSAPCSPLSDRSCHVHVYNACAQTQPTGAFMMRQIALDDG